MKNICAISLLVFGTSALAAEGNRLWNQCYVGAHAGSASVENHFVGTFFAEEVINDDLGAKKGDGEQFGIQVGCRKQLSDQWVLGMKVSGSEGKNESKQIYLGGTGINNFVSYESNNYSSISGQIGFLLSDNSLLYLNLGYGQVQLTIEDSDPTYIPEPILFRNKRTLNDVLLGLGFEHRFNNQWSLFAEYNQINFGSDRNVVFNDLSNYWDIDDYTATVSHDMNYFQVGLNYNF
jgi:opacity protein-like surface antigen